MCLAWWSCDSRAVWLERIPLRWIVQWRLSPVLRRWVLTGAVALGCLLWAMVVVGLSFAIVERSAPQWWLMLVFGMVVPLVTLVVVRGNAGDHACAIRVSTQCARRASLGRLYPRRSASAPRLSDSRGAVAVSGMPAEPLGGRELEVLEQLAAGRSNTEIAKALYVAPGTVKAHLNRIFRKLGAEIRLQAVMKARVLALLIQ